MLTAEEMAREQGKTLSAVIQDALREARSRRLKKELRALQGFWSRKARAKGILSERDLERYLTVVKVVFDTNIFVSAFVLPGGSAAKAVNRLIEGRDQLVFSKEILDEPLGVRARKFGRDREELARVAVFVDELGQRVQPRTRLSHQGGPAALETRGS